MFVCFFVDCQSFERRRNATQSNAAAMFVPDFYFLRLFLVINVTFVFVAASQRNRVVVWKLAQFIQFLFVVAAAISSSKHFN